MYSLDSAMENFNIESELDRHDALNDAYFTALVSKHLNIEQGIRDYERISQVSVHTSDFLMSFEYEGYKSSLAVLKDKSVMHSPCPFCHSKSKHVKRWKQGRFKYVVLNECKHHGYFVSRIRFNKVNDQKFIVNKELYRYDETNKQYFDKKFTEWTVV
jgi:DNA polymerase III epsilon subunit-like protein